MKTLRLCGLVLVLLVLSSFGSRDLPSLDGAAAAPTTITFDDRPVGTRIVDQYAGVRFPDGAFISGGPNSPYPTQSPPNFLQKDCSAGNFEFDSAPLRIQFTTGQGWVGAYVGNPENFEQTVVMRAYNAMTEGQVVGTTEVRLGPRAGITTLLQICRAVARDIRRVEISLGSASCEVIDDLSFDSDPLRTLGGITTVTFDDRPEFTRISTQYAGLEFPDRPWIRTATSLDTTTQTPPNALEQYSFAGEFDSPPLRVNLTRSQAWVRVFVGSEMPSRITMRAFPTGSRTPAATVYAELPRRAPITTPLEICRLVERDIARIEIQHGSEEFERIDDFQFAGTRISPPPSDTQAPRVFIDSPRTGDFFFPRDGVALIPVQGRITENRGLERVALVHEQVDDAGRVVRVVREDATMLRLVSGSAPNFSFRFEVSLSPGRNRIRIEATDTAGNRATNPEREVTVRLAPPLQVIIDEPPGAFYPSPFLGIVGRVRKPLGTLPPERLRISVVAETGSSIPVRGLSIGRSSDPEFFEFWAAASPLQSEGVLTRHTISVTALSEDGASATASVLVFYVSPDVVIAPYPHLQITQGTLYGVRGEPPPLVADRTTVVRIPVPHLVFPELRFPTPPVTSVSDLRLTLSAVRDGRELGALEIPGRYRATATSFLDTEKINVTLPAEWTREGDLELIVRVIPTREHSECGRCSENNTQRVRVRFAPPKTLRIVPVRIRLRDMEPISESEIAPLFEGIRRTYPLSRIELLPPVILNSTASREDFDRDSEGAIKHILREVTNTFTCFRGIEDVGSFFDAVWAWLTDCEWDTYWVGILPPALECPGGMGWGPPFEGPVSVSESTHRTVAHEVAHNLGRKHAGNDHGEAGGGGFDDRFPYPHGSIGYPGFDTTAMREIPARAPYPPGWSPTLRVPCREAAEPEHTHDFMSYGRGPYWISPYTWQALFDHPFRGGLRGAEQRRSISAATVSSDSGLYLFVSGDFTDEGDVRLRPFYTGQLPAGASVIAGEGRYSVVLERADGRVLFTGRFDSEEIPDGGGHVFSTIIPFPADTARIVLKDGERVLATRIVTAHAPQVTVVSPREGDVWEAEGTRTVMWTGSDADGDTVYYLARYTPDGGRTWFALNDWTTEPSVEVDASGLGGSSQALIQVIATDGVNTTRIFSAPFRVPPKGPFVVIHAPLNDAIFRPDQLIRLEGMASDREDGGLPEKALEWTSDRDGVLGHGATVDVRRLSPGVHKITLTATDSDGQSGQASIFVRVTEQRTLTAMPGMSGSVDNAGRVDDKSVMVGNGPKAGQPLRERVLRSFISFDLSGLPHDVEIVEAHLTLVQRDIVGNPHLKELGDVVVDLVDYGASLGGDDFEAPVLMENVGTLPDSGLLGPKALDVTEAIRRARDRGLSRVQFRLRFSKETDDDGRTDTAVFDPAVATQRLELQAAPAGTGARSTTR